MLLRRLLPLLLAPGCSEVNPLFTTSDSVFVTTTPTGETPPSTATTASSGFVSDTQSSDPTPTTDTTLTTGAPDPTTTTAPVLTSTTSDATATTSGDTTTTSGDTTTTSGDTSTGAPPACMDAVAHSFVPTGATVDMAGFMQLQGSWYDPILDRICFIDNDAEGRCFTPEGALLTPVSVALDLIDGAIYDAATDMVLTVSSQTCAITELDPTTLAIMNQIVLDKVEFNLGICAGIALTVPGGDLYITNYAADELVVISRDGQTELDRIDLAPAMIDGPDGISVISGSGDILLMGTNGGPRPAAIIGPTGAVIVPGANIGGVDPPIKGGTFNNPDDILAVCKTSHVWVCDYYTKCSEYMPEDGDRDFCGCLAGP